MAGYQDYVEFYEDFLGAQAITAVGAEGQVWEGTYTGTTPTTLIGGINGLLTMALSSATEIQNVCVAFENDLNFDTDLIQFMECGVSMGQAAMDATSSFAFGLASARNDVIDTIGEHALFRVIGADSTTALVVESDDGTNDNDDVATGTTLINVQKKFVISFAAGSADVRFFVDGARVAAGTTFDMSNYTAGLQPYFQLQKTSDNNTNSAVIDYVCIRSRRSAS